MAIVHLLQKLRGRSTAELRERLGQRVAQWAERAGWRDVGEQPDALARTRHAVDQLEHEEGSEAPCG